MNWDEIIPLCDQSGFTDRGGQVIYDYYLSNLAMNIAEFVKDPVQKDAFVTAFGSAKKIAFSWDEKAADGKNYHWIVNNSGVLEIHVPKSRFNVNVQSVGEKKDMLEATQPTDGLTTKSKMNLRDYEADGKKEMERIKAATGVEYQLDLDWVEFDKACTAAKNEGYLGQVVYNFYVKALANSLEKICKDDLAKEAFVEATPKKVIKFKLMSEAEVGDRRFSRSSFEDGAYVLNIGRENFCANTEIVGNDIESLL